MNTSIPNERLLRVAAFECFSNAHSLRDEARLLAENGYAARAAALAILGLEEFAKAIAYSLAALLPERQESLIKRLDWHEVKHLIASSAEAAEIETEDYRIEFLQETGFRVTPEERLEILFAQLLRYDVASVAADLKGAKEYFKRLRKELTHALPGPDLKNAALYVDISPEGEVRTPKRVEDLAESQILGLEWFLGVYAALSVVLENDAVWADFIRRVHRA